jgi:hypothetical protein
MNATTRVRTLHAQMTYIYMQHRLLCRCSVCSLLLLYEDIRQHTCIGDGDTSVAASHEDQQQLGVQAEMQAPPIPGNSIPAGAFLDMHTPPPEVPAFTQGRGHEWLPNTGRTMDAFDEQVVTPRPGTDAKRRARHIPATLPPVISSPLRKKICAVQLTGAS